MPATKLRLVPDPARSNCSCSGLRPARNLCCMNRLLRALVVLAAVVLAPALHAQAAPSPWMPSLGAGRAEWDPKGMSDATVVAMRGSRNILTRVTGFEWGAMYGSFKESDRLDPTQVMSIDSRLVLQTPWTTVQPFVGAGPTLFWYVTNQTGRDQFELGLNAGGGVRVRVQQGLHVIADARWRGWDFANATGLTVNEGMEITLSLGFRR